MDSSLIEDDEPVCAVPSSFGADSRTVGYAPPAVAESKSEVSPEERKTIIDAVCDQLVKEAERQQHDISKFARLCNDRYGRGAFTVYFNSLDDACARQSIFVNDWIRVIEQQMGSRPATPRESQGAFGGQLDSSLDFLFECPQGSLGRRIVYVKAERMRNQFPNSVTSGLDCLEHYDTDSQICVCGGVNSGGNECELAITSSVSLEILAGMQRDQSQQWAAPRKEVTRLETLANDEFKRGDDDLALVNYLAALRVQLDCGLEDLRREVNLRLQIATLLARSDKLVEAEKMCSAALELDPQDAKVLFRRGNVLQKLGRSEEAREDLASAARTMLKDRDIRAGLDPSILEAPKLPIPPLQRGLAWLQLFWRCIVGLVAVMWKECAIFTVAVAFFVATFPADAFWNLTGHLEGRDMGEHWLDIQNAPSDSFETVRVT